MPEPPYNASHTRNVAGYAISIVDHINEQFRQGKSELFFTEEHKNQIVMAAYLHDIGKLIVPLSVMNKQTRLGSRIQDIQSRLTIIELKYRVDRLSGAISEAEALQAQQRIDKTRALVQQVNDAPFLTDAVLEQVKTASAYHYIGPSQQETIPFLTSSELDCLMIRKGTLTDEERRIMESHVEMTERILSKVRFNHSFAMAPVWAAQHHEHLNGKGYPRGLSQEELGIEARILAVADICDALLAADRPYKKPLPQEKAFAIMDDMAKNGMIDANIVGYMKACLASAE